MTSIALHSDLHLERQGLPKDWLQEVPDILILAGDIIRIDDSYRLLTDLAEKYEDMQILYVTGNHEYYDIENMLEAERILKASLMSHERIHFLQNDTIEINGIRFLGTTGWSRMLSLGIEKQLEAKYLVGYSINDFRLIGYEDRVFNVDDCIELGEQQYEWLKAELSKATDCKHTVVITHFSPSLKLRNTQFPVDEMSAYFHASFDDLIEEYQPDMWMFGHTHANFDIHMGKTRVISNQKGYGRECINSYQPDWVISL
jgi:Icc-related predicted phosphoesterase